MTSGSNNPENATATPAVVESYDLSTPDGKAKVPTQITIQGQTFELKNMSVAHAQSLYNLFGADDQARVQGLAGFMKNFKAPLLSELPESLQGPGKVEEFVKHLQESGGKVVANTPDWIKQLYNDAGDLTSKAPGVEHVRDIMGAISMAGSAVSTGISAANETKDWVLLLPRATQYLVTRGAEMWNSNGKPATDEQAMALATAYQGSLIASRREPNFMDKIGAGLEKGWSWFSNSAFGQWATAVVTAGLNWISGDGWNYDEIRAQQAATKTESRSYEQILNENLEDPVQAAARLRNADTVADRKTAPLADTLEAAATNGAALYADHDDNVNAMNDSNQSEAVTKPNGEPLKASEVNTERFKEVSGSIGKGGVASGLLGAAGAGHVGYRVGQGVARGRITGPEARAAKFGEVDEKLRAKQIKATLAGNLDEADKIREDRIKNKVRLDHNEELAESRKDKAGKFTQKALDQIDEAKDVKAPRWYGRMLQNVGEKFSHLSGSAVDSIKSDGARIGAAVKAAPAAAAATASKSSSLWTSARSVVSGLRGLGGGKRGRVGLALGGLGVLGFAVAPIDSAMAAADSKTDDEKSEHAKDSAIQGVGVTSLGVLGMTGAQRILPGLAPIYETTQTVSAAVRGDQHGVVASGGRLATISAFTAGGAAAGTPFFGVGAIPGAIGGLTVGSLVVGADYVQSIFTGKSAYDKIADVTVGTEEQLAAQKAKAKAPKAEVASNDGAAGAVDEGLAAAVVGAQTQAQKAAKSMLAHSVKIGAVKPEATPESGLFDSFSFGKMDVFKGDFNPFS